MIIRRLVLHNFGVYAGTNIMSFSGDKPVVLIGGMNGRGKTTFLEAVLLALYGSNSFAYSQDSKYSTYGQYLRAFVNEADQTLQTYIELEFLMDKGNKEVYLVHREWDGNAQRIHERISVKRNNEENQFLTENWSMFIENILPSALSNFFFFDGEKIAELAVEDTSSQMKESIKSMLGISVLDVLEGDVGKIIYRLTKKNKEKEEYKELDALREEKEEAYAALNNIDKTIQKYEEKSAQIKEKKEKKVNEYSIKGGDIVEQRGKLLKERSENYAMILNAQEQLYDLAGGELPFSLVLSLVKDIKEQSDKEAESKNAKITIKNIEKYYHLFSENNKNSEGVNKFIDFIKEQQLGDTNGVYNLPDASIVQIKNLSDGGIKSIQEKIKELKTIKEKSERKINEIDNYLSVDIDEKSLNRIFREIKSLEKEIITIEVEIEELTHKRTSLNGNYMMLESKFSKTAESLLSELENSDSDDRVAKYSNMAIEIIKEYRIRLQSRKTGILAETMTDCYKQLANKKNHIKRIIMDSSTLDLHYLDENGKEIEKKGLSAGEKQLMVISLLWALAICSQKKLPVIIDTPLSRLDSAHRSALIKKYFPKASDQTIILSTDSEIDEHYYRMMRESVGDTYTLHFNDNEKRTVIESGYFGY